MKQSMFVNLDDADDIRRNPGSTSVYVGDYLTLSGTRAAYEKLRDAVTAILADMLVAPVGDDA